MMKKQHEKMTDNIVDCNAYYKMNSFEMVCCKYSMP